VAQKYLELVLQRSNACLDAMNDGLQTLNESRAVVAPPAPKAPKLHPVPSQTQISSILWGQPGLRFSSAQSCQSISKQKGPAFAGPELATSHWPL